MTTATHTNPTTGKQIRVLRTGLNYSNRRTGREWVAVEYVLIRDGKEWGATRDMAATKLAKDWVAL